MTERFYTQGDYLREHPTWHAEDSAWKAEQIMAMLTKNAIAPRTICEVGFGAGEVLNQLYARFPDTAEFVGYELSPQALDIARPKEKPRLRYLLGDLTSEHVYFDLLLCIDVFEHVEDYMAFLRGIASKAEYKIFHIPLELSVHKLLRRSSLLESRRHLGHLHYFTEETALATLEDTGYTVVDCFYTNSGGVNLASKPLKSRMTWSVRRTLAALNPNLAARIAGGFSLLVLAK